MVGPKLKHVNDLRHSIEVSIPFVSNSANPANAEVCGFSTACVCLTLDAPLLPAFTRRHVTLGLRLRPASNTPTRDAQTQSPATAPRDETLGFGPCRSHASSGAGGLQVCVHEKSLEGEGHRRTNSVHRHGTPDMPPIPSKLPREDQTRPSRRRCDA